MAKELNKTDIQRLEAVAKSHIPKGYCNPADIKSNRLSDWVRELSDNYRLYRNKALALTGMMAAVGIFGYGVHTLNMHSQKRAESSKLEAKIARVKIVNNRARTHRERTNDFSYLVDKQGINYSKDDGFFDYLRNNRQEPRRQS